MAIRGILLRIQYDVAHFRVKSLKRRAVGFYYLGWPPLKVMQFNLLFLCLFVNGDLVETHKRPMRFSFRSKFIEQNKMKSKPTISYHTVILPD